jgi:hypothetical protein
MSSSSSSLLDSLPYIDTEYNDPQMQRKVDDLIMEEMKKSTKTPQEYLDELQLPTVPTQSQSPLIQLELDNLYSGGGKKLLSGSESSKSAIDISKYSKLTRPSGPNPTAEQWEQALANAKIAIEHQSSALINLQLLKRYKPIYIFLFIHACHFSIFHFVHSFL